jgi:hypothetical protein
MQTLITNARTHFAPITAPVVLPAKRIEFDAELNEYVVYCGETFVCYTNTENEAQQAYSDHLVRTRPRLVTR